MPELKLFTVENILEWLNGKVIEGLSEQVIAPQRAWAIAHNPYVREDDAVVAAIYEGQELAAFTACFPDIVDSKRVWWFSTLSCRPESAGKGYGLICIGSLSEVHEGEDIFDMNGAVETIEIFDYLGSKKSFIPMYILRERLNTATGIRHILTNSKAVITRWANERNKSKVAKYNRSNAHYKIRYIHHLSDRLYEFICAHREKDAFLRTKEMLNWIIEYPFMLNGIVTHRVIDNKEFGSVKAIYNKWNVEVYLDQELVGYYMLRMRDNELAVKYLYYNPIEQKETFASIMDHILKLKPDRFVTCNESLANYINKTNIFPKMEKGNISFSYPQWYNYIYENTMQDGDGDMFV